MPIYEVTDPDGATFEVTAPEGASQADILNYVKAQRAAQNPEGIGSTPGDKRRMTPQQILQTLQAQLADPHRNPGSDAELQAAIARAQKDVDAAAAASAPDNAMPAHASQADVRKSEPAMTPLQTQAERERRWNAASQEFVRKGIGNTVPAGIDPAEWRKMNRVQRIEAWSGVPNPARTEEQANLENLRAGGEPQYEDGLYMAAQGAAGLAGFGAGGPFGATAVQSLVRLKALTDNLDKALAAGAIDQDRYDEILGNELSRGAALDAIFNFGVPLAGTALGGVRDMLLKRFGSTAAQSIERVLQRNRALAQRVGIAKTPAEKQAVQEIGNRTAASDAIPTPGQVTGEASGWEATTRKGSPRVYARQQKEIEGAVQGMHDEGLNPSSYPGREGLGTQIASEADKVQQAVKNRLRPTFEAADNLGVRVDMQPVVDRLQSMLQRYRNVPGGSDQERAYLEGILKNLTEQQPTSMTGHPMMSAQDALDFMSNMKTKLRSTTADWKPSDYFGTVVGQLTKDTDGAFTAAAARAGKPDVATNLAKARDEYRQMMDTVYDGPVKDAMRRDPEEVGRRFWQTGNVTEVKQLADMLKMAEREKTMTPDQTRELTRNVTLGFLQEAVPTVESAAQWSAKLKANPKLRDTWGALTAQPGGAQLRATMDVLEQAAKIAGRDSTALLADRVIPLAVQRGVQGSAGVSPVQGTIHPGIVAASLSLTGITRAAATAYTSGSTGVANGIMRALRANMALAGNRSTGSAVSAVAARTLQEELPKIEAFAQEHGFSIYGDTQQPPGGQ